MLRREVDVLSATASYSHAMHMAISGARDLSVIDTRRKPLPVPLTWWSIPQSNQEPYSGNSTVAGRFIISIIVSRQLKNGHKIAGACSQGPDCGGTWPDAGTKLAESCTSFA